MRICLQRVRHASVEVAGEAVGEIGDGLVALVGFCETDTADTAARLLDKMLRLRIFPDAAGKTNRSLADIGGCVLLVPQFTLYADARHGNRPSFTAAAPPEQAQALYRFCRAYCQEQGYPAESGIFGAHMLVSLQNDGPFTLWLDSDEVLGKK